MIHKVVRAIPSFAWTWYNGDDTKIFRRVSTKQTEVILQEDINEMLKWVDQWQLEFHPDKYVKMSINNKELENRTYNMDDIVLRNVKQEKDIGVIIDDQLNMRIICMRK